MSTDTVAYLLEEMEEYYGAFDYYPLYQLGWHLRRGTPMTDQMRDLARQAYDAFTTRHATRVVWTTWPTDETNTWPLGPDDQLDFDLDPEGSVDEPLQIIVPE